MTLVGLVSSYFVRSATAFDTLSQMGRWFGFRIGYEDLPRIWMTGELENWFRDLALLEADLRLDLSKYAQDELTPLDFQARIRTHSSVAVTSRAKQQAAIVSNPGYSRQRVQTILFKHKDAEWLNSNLDATRALVNRLRSAGYRSFVKNSNGTVVFRGVSTDDVIQFLMDYSFYETSILGADGASSLIRYIERERQNASIREWSVSFYGHSKNEGSREDVLGLGTPINAVNRSQLRSSDAEVANIKSLVGSMDRLNDVELDASALNELVKTASGKTYNDRLIEVRDAQVGPDVGHLTIYLIDKESKTHQPEGGLRPDGRFIQPRNRRKDLQAVEDIVGVGIFFPESNSPEEEAEYIQAPPPDEEVQDSILDAEMFTTRDR